MPLHKRTKPQRRSSSGHTAAWVWRISIPPPPLASLLIPPLASPLLVHVNEGSEDRHPLLKGNTLRTHTRQCKGVDTHPVLGSVPCTMQASRTTGMHNTVTVKKRACVKRNGAHF